MKATEKNNEVTTGEGPSEIERLKEELRREHEMYLRALADFDNYRRRVERERSAAARSGKREVILSLLDVLDGFDRAFQHISDAPSSMSERVQAIHRKLLGLLEAQGVTPLKSLGETFNPEMHDAVGSVQSEEYEPGAVAEEVQRGYRWGDDVLRPARVRVAL
ncbi:MAG TPA: nucleotide exchange factor GrpE [Candidatus Binatia bacterium]|jgi:molecular chaperone GrpE|nr:nucleotide exchange factor GrpE [Candidatus Binatia bacterium]